MTTSLLRSPLLHSRCSGDNARCQHKLYTLCRWSSSKLISLWLNDYWNFQYTCAVLRISPMMQDQKSCTLWRSSFSGWRRERVSLLFDYTGGQYIKQRQRCTNVDIWQLTVGYLNVTINGKTRKPDQEIGTDGSRGTRQNLGVDLYRCGFGLKTISGSGFWMSLEPSRIFFPGHTQTTRGLPGHVFNNTG